MSYYRFPVRIGGANSRTAANVDEVFSDSSIQIPISQYSYAEINDAIPSIKTAATNGPTWQDNPTQLSQLATLFNSIEYKVPSMAEHRSTTGTIRNITTDDRASQAGFYSAVSSVFPSCTISYDAVCQYYNPGSYPGYRTIRFYNPDNSNEYLQNWYPAVGGNLTIGTSQTIVTPLGFFYNNNAAGPINASFGIIFIDKNGIVCVFKIVNFVANTAAAVTTYSAGISASIIAWLQQHDTPLGYNISYHLVHATGDADNPTSVPVETAEHVDQFFRFYPEAGYELKYGTVPIGTGYGPDDSVIRVWNAERGEMIIRGFTSDITIEVIGVGSPYPIPGSDDSGETHPGSDSYDLSSDPPPTHNVPSWDTTQAGFINVYVPDAAGLNRLANYLWAGSFDPDNLRKLFANPMDVILGCHILPVAVPTADNPAQLAVGNVSTGISMPVASSNWVQYDCGTLDIPVFYEAYMSFSPYTKVQLYLPFCGTYEIDPDIIMGREMGVVYNIDVLTGACVVDVSARSADEEGGTIYYQFTGNCAAELPVTAGDYKNILQVLQSAAVAGIGIIGGAAGGGALGAAGTVAAGVGQVASSITDMVKPNVSHSGSVSGNAGYMGLPMPYVTIITPRLCKPDNQNEYIGLPIYATAALSEMTGYTVVDSIHFEGFSCTDEELNELETMLHGGVIF